MVTRDFNEFRTVCNPLDPDIALGALYAIFQDRFDFDLDFEEKTSSTILNLQRDSLRVFLHEKKLLARLTIPSLLL